nr:hypothetical protein [Chlamydiota bacterium]
MLFGFPRNQLPDGLKIFFQDNRISLPALEESPNKLLKFYLYLNGRNISHNPKNLDEQCNAAILKTFKETLLAQHEAGKLSDYHMAKLIANCPELLEDRKDQLKELIAKFFDELKGNKDDKKMLNRAYKMSRFLFANEGLVEERFLTCKITSNNNTEHTIHRIKWARKAKAWRPW